jgi:hypothetical protein
MVWGNSSPTRFDPRIVINGKKFFTWGKQPDLEVKLSFPYSAEVKNERNCTPAPVTCLNGVGRENSGQ